MRLAFAIVGVGLFLTACNRSPKPVEELSEDQRLSKLAVGSWARPGGVMEIDADGTSTTTFSNRVGKNAAFYQCDWKVTNSFFVITVNNIVASHTNHEPIGSVERVKIISLDATQFVWQPTVKYANRNPTNGTLEPTNDPDFFVTWQRLK